jgi:A/G-specific adenine glycosylase
MTVEDNLARILLAWYDRERRHLPWRAAPGEAADPYKVWISEIMLQQTTVAAVVPYFHAFLARFPSLPDLAAADPDEVLHAWQGLGYYARARNLHACARALVERNEGRMPATEAELRALPGIGASTAAAIAAIAHGEHATPVDGNVLRVVARLFAVDAPLPGARAHLNALAAGLTPSVRPGCFAQGMMDLGATVCTPRRPRCGACPWRGACAAFAAGDPERYPQRAAKPEKPLRRGVVFWVQRADGRLLVRRRPRQGLLGGMIEFPSTDWRADAWSPADVQAAAPFDLQWEARPGTVRHTFTHFHLELRLWAGRRDGMGEASGDASGFWWPADDLDALALPTLMKKVARLARSPYSS